VGRRITVFTRPDYQLEDRASIVEELVEAAGERGVRIQSLLLDKGFYTTNTINTLNRLKVKYIMPAVKNGRVKQIIEDYHNYLTSNTIKLTLRRDDGEEASFNLTIHPKKEAKDTEPIHERYIAFATNTNHKEKFKLYPKIPEEYKKRWA
jgi:transposase